MAKSGTIGIDVGGTKTLFALFDGDFRPLEEIKIKTPTDERTAFSRAIRENVGALVQEAKRGKMKVSAIGVGCAGHIEVETGIVRFSPNIPQLKDFSFRQALKKLNDAPVYPTVAALFISTPPDLIK